MEAYVEPYGEVAKTILDRKRDGDKRMFQSYKETKLNKIMEPSIPLILLVLLNTFINIISHIELLDNLGTAIGIFIVWKTIDMRHKNLKRIK